MLLSTPVFPCAQRSLSRNLGFLLSDSSLPSWRGTEGREDEGRTEASARMAGPAQPQLSSRSAGTPYSGRLLLHYLAQDGAQVHLTAPAGSESLFSASALFWLPVPLGTASCRFLAGRIHFHGLLALTCDRHARPTTPLTAVHTLRTSETAFIKPKSGADPPFPKRMRTG